jgi:hypothetical protein
MTLGTLHRSGGGSFALDDLRSTLPITVGEIEAIRMDGVALDHDDRALRRAAELLEARSASDDLRLPPPRPDLGIAQLAEMVARRRSEGSIGPAEDRLLTLCEGLTDFRARLESAAQPRALLSRRSAA